MSSEITHRSLWLIYNRFDFTCGNYHVCVWMLRPSQLTSKAKLLNLSLLISLMTDQSVVLQPTGERTPGLYSADESHPQPLPLQNKHTVT